MNNYTTTPNNILVDFEISSNACRLWQLIMMKEGIEGWIHHLSYYAKLTNKSIGTVRTWANEIIKKGYLIRTPKDNSEFGYIYEIPEEYNIKKSSTGVKNTDRKSPDRNFPDRKNQPHNNIDPNKKEINKKERELEEHTHTHFEIEIKEELRIEENSKSVLTIKEESLMTKPIIKNEEKYSGAVARDTRLNLPKGEWLDEETGDFKEGFLTWRGDYAIRTFSDIETPLQARQWARKNFYNRPQELPLFWHQYQEEFNFRANNIQTRLDHGCEIKEVEQQKVGRMYVELNNIPNTPQKTPESPKGLIQMSTIINEEMTPNTSHLSPSPQIPVTIESRGVEVEKVEILYDEYGNGRKHEFYQAPAKEEEEQIPVNHEFLKRLAQFTKGGFKSKAS